MRFSYKEPGGSWANLPAEDVEIPVMLQVNRASTLKIPVPSSFYGKIGSWDDSWLVQGLDLVQICVTHDDDDYSDLNTDFDGTYKYFWGRVIEIEHHESVAVLICEEIHAKLLREPVAGDSNVVDDAHVVDGITGDYVVGTGFPSFTVNEHQGRIARFIAKSSERRQDPADTGFSGISATGWDGTGTSTTTGTPGSIRVDNESTYRREITGSSDSSFYLDAEIEIPVYPFPDGEITVVVKLRDMSGFTCYVDAYDYENTTYNNLLTIENADADYSINIVLTSFDIIDEVNDLIKIRLRVPCEPDGGGTYEAALEIAYVGVDYQWGYQHEPVEVLISSNDTYSITISEKVKDLGINIHDDIEILYNDQEILEDVVSGLDPDCSSITVPSSTAGTLTKFNFRPAGLVIDEICRRNGWYYYRSVETSSGGYQIVVRERDNPLTGVTLNQGGCDAATPFIVAWRALNRYRGVIVTNGTNYACRGIDGASTTTVLADIDPGDLPLAVLSRQDLKDAQLQDVADAIYDAMSNVPVIIENVRARNLGSGTLDIGETCSYNLVPSEKGLTDYQIVGSAIISRIVFNRDNTFTLKLGLDDTRDRSFDKIADLVLTDLRFRD